MADVPYTPYPTVENTGNLGPGFGVRATPEDAGAAVGRAMQRTGKIAQDLTAQYMEEASEAKANDILANQWAPTIAKMRVDYDSLQGQDKVHGYQAYLNGLKNLQKELTEKEGNSHTKKLVLSDTTKQIVSETHSATAGLAAWQKQFNNQTTKELIYARNGYVANNYNNPEVVKSVTTGNDALITKQFIDNGVDPNTPEGAAQIDNARRTVRGEMAVGMITRAVQSGDMSTANSLRAEYGTVIPGYQQIQIDNLLGVENLRQTSVQSVRALKSGNPLPQPMGLPPVKIQASLARAAQAEGVDPNTALAYLSIESSNGTNLGKRGTILQDKEGGTLEDQIARAPKQIRASEEIAGNALGRPALPWEGYVVHQQGSGGGAELLKDSQKPLEQQALAIDVLRQFEGKEKGYNAYAAIVENGGNATMTSGQFTDFIRQRYDNHARMSTIQIASSGEIMTDAGQAILSAHEGRTPPLQPAANPIQALQNYERQFSSYIAKANAIPNTEVRKAVIASMEEDLQNYRTEEGAYKSAIQHEAQQLAVRPDFTSTDQIPAELKAKLLDMPQTMVYMQERAKWNQENASGAITKDMREYGVGYLDALKGINASDGAPNRITDIAQLQARIGKDITVQGYEWLSKKLEESRSPDKAAENRMFGAVLDAGKEMLLDDKEQWPSALVAITNLDERLKAEKIPASERYSGIENKNSVLHALDPFIMQEQSATAVQDALSKIDKPSWLFNLSPKRAALTRKIINNFEDGLYSGDDAAKAEGYNVLKRGVTEGYLDRENFINLAIAYGYAKPPRKKEE